AVRWEYWEFAEPTSFTITRLRRALSLRRLLCSTPPRFGSMDTALSQDEIEPRGCGASPYCWLFWAVGLWRSPVVKLSSEVARLASWLPWVRRFHIGSTT